MTANQRFFRLMSFVIAAAGLVWLGLALWRVSQGGAFDWVGLGIFTVIIVALALGSLGRGTRA